MWKQKFNLIFVSIQLLEIHGMLRVNIRIKIWQQLLVMCQSKWYLSKVLRPLSVFQEFYSLNFYVMNVLEHSFEIVNINFS